jgi:hypothetical protein
MHNMHNSLRTIASIIAIVFALALPACGVARVANTPAPPLTPSPTAAMERPAPLSIPTPLPLSTPLPAISSSLVTSSNQITTTIASGPVSLSASLETTEYVDPATGFRIRYPANWFLEVPRYAGSAAQMSAGYSVMIMNFDDHVIVKSETLTPDMLQTMKLPSAEPALAPSLTPPLVPALPATATLTQAYPLRLGAQWVYSITSVTGTPDHIITVTGYLTQFHRMGSQVRAIVRGLEVTLIRKSSEQLASVLAITSGVNSCNS